MKTISKFIQPLLLLLIYFCYLYQKEFNGEVNYQDYIVTFLAIIAINTHNLKKE